MPILWLRIALLPGWLRDKLEMRQIGMTQQDKLGDQAVSNVGAATASIKTSFDAVTSQLVEMFSQQNGLVIGSFVGKWNFISGLGDIAV